MVFGTTQFKCDECGNKFEGLAMEYCASAITAPVPCPKCGSMHTYPAGALSIFNLIGPSPIYKMIWKREDEWRKDNKDN